MMYLKSKLVMEINLKIAARQAVSLNTSRLVFYITLAEMIIGRKNKPGRVVGTSCTRRLTAEDFEGILWREHGSLHFPDG